MTIGYKVTMFGVVYDTVTYNAYVIANQTIQSGRYNGGYDGLAPNAEFVWNTLNGSTPACMYQTYDPSGFSFHSMVYYDANLMDNNGWCTLPRY